VPQPYLTSVCLTRIEGARGSLQDQHPTRTPSIAKPPLQRDLAVIIATGGNTRGLIDAWPPRLTSVDR
jgi:hypothetical protein